MIRDSLTAFIEPYRTDPSLDSECEERPRCSESRRLESQRCQRRRLAVSTFRGKINANAAVPELGADGLWTRITQRRARGSMLTIPPDSRVCPASGGCLPGCPTHCRRFGRFGWHLLMTSPRSWIVRRGDPVIRRTMRVSVVGLGKLGSPLAAVLPVGTPSDRSRRSPGIGA